MPRKYTNEALAAKIDWEGDVLDAIEYGISEGDIEDPKVAALWRKAMDLYLELGPLLEEIEEALEESDDIPA